jgi:DNA-binding GntR family transcriptional regulator
MIKESRVADQADNQGFSESRPTLRVDRESLTLTQKVGEGLRNAILSGHFEPGQRLVERNLCELTGVSRTAVREALRSLEAEGLVVNVPNRGPTVISISRKEAADIYAVRSLLEVQAVELFVPQMTEADDAALSDLASKMEEAYRLGDLELVNTLKRQFYAIFVGGCGNQIIARMLDQLYAKISVLRHMTMAQSNRMAAAVKELRQIQQAMAARDVKAAKKACQRHIEAAAAVALEALARQDERSRRDRA